MKPYASCLAAFLLLPLAATAATPREELLRLVPDDVGFCLVVQDFRGHADVLQASPFVQHFRRSPLGIALQGSQEMHKLEEAEKFLQKTLRVDAARLRDDIFGDAVVFAYRPGPAGQVKQDQDLILLRARDPKLLAELLDRINQVQKETGELKELEPREHGGQKYFHRVDRQDENYYWLNGPILALSSKEEMLRRVLERNRKQAADESVVSRQLRLLNADRNLAALWINPRAFEPEMEHKAAGAAGPEAAVLQNVLRHWKTLDGLALGFDVRKDLAVSLTVRVRMEALPAATRRLLTEAARQSELWDRFPEDALLTAAGRADAAALLDVVGDLLSQPDREALHDGLERNLGAVLGKSVVKEVLPLVGPDWGICVMAPSSAEPRWFPHIVVALRVRPGDKKPGVDQALLSAVHFFAVAAVLEHNRKNKDAMTLQTAVQDQVEVKYLVSDTAFLPGLQPAFALCHGYLVLASSPEAVRRFSAATPRTLPPSQDLPLIRVSIGRLRDYLQARREPVALAVADKNGITKEEAERRLDGLLLGLQLFERLEVSQRPGDGQVTLTLRLQPIQPLSK
jgi:hypothetical protein